MTNRTNADLFQVLLVKSGRTRSLILLSRNAASYSSRPRLRSQTTTSMTAPTISGGAHHPLAYGECPGLRWGSQGRRKAH